MTNSELFGILQAKQTELTTDAQVLNDAAAARIPKPVNANALRIMNLAGMTVPPVELVIPPDVDTMQEQALIYIETAGRIGDYLATLPNDNQDATITMSQAMDLGINAHPTVLASIAPQ
mgnify:CR=1 FL=1|jgi:hypothetical protein